MFSKSVVESFYRSFPILSMPQLFIVKDMLNHPKLPKPFGYYIPAVHPNAIGDKEKMVLCQHAAERQFVTKCKGGPQAAWTG